MAVKNVIQPFHAIVAGDMSQSSLTSPVTDIGWLDNVSIQLNFTGTPTGTFEVDVSLDKVNFVPLTLSPTPAAAGSAGQIIIDLNQLASRYIRVKYSRSSGSGSLDMFIAAKEV